jgi:hypothetical protein
MITACKTESLSTPHHSAILCLIGCSLISIGLAQASAAVAQTLITITGITIDGITNTPISNVRVSNQQRQVTTDETGYFTIQIEQTEASLRFQINGYLETTVIVEATTLEVRLFPNTFTDTITVLPPPLTQEHPSDNPISSQEVFRIAGSVDNVFRTLDLMPGVASTDDFGSRLAVRGGTPDQNLTVMDGVEIHNPYRLFGITSAFNPETVQDFNLTAGGFGVAYGDRLSSLLIVNNRKGKKDFQGSTALSITDTNIVLEGTTPVWNNGTWLFSARRTYYDLFAESLLSLDGQFPSFTDFQLQTEWDFEAGHRLSVTGLHSSEGSNLDFEGDRPGENIAFGSDANNNLLSVRFDAVIGSRATATTIMARSDNHEFLGFNGVVRADARRSNSPVDAGAFGLAKIIFERSISVRDLSLREEFAFQASSRHLLSAGLDLHRLNTGVGFAIRGDRNQNEANGSSITGGTGLPDVLQSTLAGTRGGLWIQDTYTPSSRLSIEPGLRLDWSTVNGRSALSPRLAASYQLNDRTQMRVAVGRYTQSPGYEKLVQSDYFIDLSNIKESKLPYEKANHFVVGVQRDLTPDLTARLEGYYKRFADLLVGRLETETERLSRISRYKFPQSQRNSIPTTPLITSNPTNNAGGVAYGLDVYMNHTNQTAPLTGWLSYNWGHANRESYGRRYAFEYDRRHAFNAVGRYRLSSKWTLAATARIASGFPHTAPIGLRVSSTENESGHLVPETDISGYPIYTVDYGGIENLNSGRLPHYARVDFRATYQPGGINGRWLLYVEVINLLGRDNPVELEPRLEHDPHSNTPRLFEVASQGFPRLPTFGLRLHF